MPDHDRSTDDQTGPAPTCIASCVWRCTPELIAALDRVLGDPVDAYVNGSQVWIDDDGPHGVAIEWRLHPVANYVKPRGVATADVFATVALAAGAGDEAGPIPAALWDGLEAFAAHDDPLEPDELRAWAVGRLGHGTTAFGRVDHEVVAAAWERDERARSIVDDLLAQLGNGAPDQPDPDQPTVSS